MQSSRDCNILDLLKQRSTVKTIQIALSLGSFFGEQCNMNLNPILQFYLVFSARVPVSLCDAAQGGNLGTRWL